jgi:tetratricopeptide (TPR) repeat protein
LRLQHFHLVHEYLPYRVFQVGPPAPAAPPAQSYRPDTELALFGGEARLTTGWDDADLLAGLAQLKESETHRLLGNEHEHAAEARWLVAEAAYRTALKLDEKNTRAWRGLARALRQRGEVDSAAEAINRARTLRFTKKREQLEADAEAEAEAEVQ